MSPNPRPVIVAAAVIRSGLLLAGRRRYPDDLAGRWELPGGKVEAGESEPAALRREILEELGVVIAVGERIGDDVELTGGAILRTRLAGLSPESPEPAAGHGHDELRWVNAAEIDDLDWLDPDVPIVAAVRAHLLATVDGPPPGRPPR